MRGRCFVKQEVFIDKEIYLKSLCTVTQSEPFHGICRLIYLVQLLLPETVCLKRLSVCNVEYRDLQTACIRPQISCHLPECLLIP